MNDRFYYNMGEFFRDMEQEEADYSVYREIGRMAAHFYQGALEVTDDAEEAFTLADSFLSHVSIKGDEAEDDDSTSGTVHG